MKFEWNLYTCLLSHTKVSDSFRKLFRWGSANSILKAESAARWIRSKDRLSYSINWLGEICMSFAYSLQDFFFSAMGEQFRVPPAPRSIRLGQHRKAKALCPRRNKKECGKSAAIFRLWQILWFRASPACSPPRRRKRRDHRSDVARPVRLEPVVPLSVIRLVLGIVHFLHSATLRELV